MWGFFLFKELETDLTYDSAVCLYALLQRPFHMQAIASLLTYTGNRTDLDGIGNENMVYIRSEIMLNCK